jgi:hypothetical protein
MHMVDAHDYFPSRAPFDARPEELTHARGRFAVNISKQHGGLNVGDFDILQPAQIWLGLISLLTCRLAHHVHHDGIMLK